MSMPERQRAPLGPLEEWPARAGSAITFVGTLGEKRIAEYRQMLRTRDPEHLALLERIAAAPGDARSAYEQVRKEPLRGSPCAYVDEVRSLRRRLEVLSALPTEALRIYGDVEWKKHAGSLGQAYAGVALHYGFDLAEVYFHSKINLNVLHHQCVDSTNSRVYDVLAAGGFLLTEHRPCLAREFELGRHLVTFSTPGEARELAEYYLEHPNERELIARAGQRHVLAHHTLAHRCRALLDRVRPLVGKAIQAPERACAPRAERDPVVYFLCPDVRFHSGGVRALYRQVELSGDTAFQQ